MALKQVNEEPKPPVVENVSVTANKVWYAAGYAGLPTPGSADAAVADAKNMRKKDRNVPETGDVTHGYLWFLLAGISLTGLLALILGKEHSDRRRKS